MSKLIPAIILFTPVVACIIAIIVYMVVTKKGKSEKPVPLLHKAPFCRLDTSNPVNKANNVCVGVEDGRPYCYDGKALDAKGNQCNNDLDCDKYSKTTLKLNPNGHTCDWYNANLANTDPALSTAYWSGVCKH